MSQQAYLLSRVSKAFVGGKWVPITQVPKATLRQTVAEGRFGQKHLGEITEAKRQIHHANASQLRELHSHKNVVGRVGRHDLSEGLEQMGPHVIRPMKAGERAKVTLLNHKTKKIVRAQNAPTHSRQAMGLKFHTNKPFINAHELAHANSTRRGVVTRTAALQNKVFSRHPELASRAVKETTLGPASFKLGKENLRAQQKYMMGEEARADVVATRRLKSNKPFFSGHIADMGSSKHYLKARNRVERGMGVRPTTEEEMYWKPRPKPLAQMAKPAQQSVSPKLKGSIQDRLRQWSARKRGE